MLKMFFQKKQGKETNASVPKAGFAWSYVYRGVSSPLILLHTAYWGDTPDNRVLTWSVT